MNELCEHWNTDGLTQCGKPARFTLYGHDRQRMEHFCREHAEDLLSDTHNGYQEVTA